MKKFTVGFFLAAVFLASTAQATMTIKDFKDAKRVGGQTWNLTQVYLEGVGEGYASANASLATNQKQQIFCVPTHFSLNLQNMLDILDKEFAHPKPIYTDDFPLVIVLLDGLERAFPCSLH
jgi:hypothetical protein